MGFTCFCIVTFFCGFNFVISSQVTTRSENVTSHNIDFVEIVKEHLRRNNEDYGEVKYEKLTFSSTGYNGISKKDSTTLKINNNDILKINRRAKIDSMEYSYDDKGTSTTKEQQVTSNATTSVNPIQKIQRSQTKAKIVKVKIAKKLNKIDLKKTVKLYTLRSTSNTTKSLQIKGGKFPKYVDKNKIVKFKKFMSKNKGLFKDFLNNKKEIQSQKTLTSNPLRTDELANFLRYSKKKNKKKVIKKSDQDTISPDLLDMAPARGGRIHRQRVKGRLCQRHVLVPEGPKYDSLGKWYLPAHNLVVSHPYNVTHPPKVLLPRCCNCCKKSVLGCE